MEVCIDFEGSLESLKEQIEPIIGGKFTKIEDEECWHKFLLGMEIELEKNDFVNDQDVDFENYPFVLSIRTSAGVPLAIRDFQVPITDLIAKLLCLELKVKVMVVRDTQTVYARYYPDEIGMEQSVLSHVA